MFGPLIWYLIHGSGSYTFVLSKLDNTNVSTIVIIYVYTFVLSKSDDTNVLIIVSTNVLILVFSYYILTIVSTHE